MRDTTLFLRIRIGKRTQFYQMVHLPVRPGARAGWKLIRSQKVCYEVVRTDDGRLTCTCADATFRQHECKHIAALKAHGVI